MSAAPAWISAIAAVGACVAAAAAAREARRSRGRTESADERRYAEQVSAWVAYRERPDAEGKPIYGVRMANRSPAPVADVRVEVTDMYGDLDPPLRLAILTTGNCFAAYRTDWARGPRDQDPHPVEWERPRLVGANDDTQPVLLSNTWSVRSVEFTDPAGVRWRRDAAGALTKLPAVAQDGEPAA